MAAGKALTADAVPDERLNVGVQLNSVAVPLAPSITVVVLTQMLILPGVIDISGNGFTVSEVVAAAVQALAAVMVTL